MKKTFLYATFLSALVILCCNDGGVQNKNPDVDGFMKLFSREDSSGNDRTMPFTVYFNGNGKTDGSVPDAITTDSGSAITLPGQQTMEKTGGYRFGGWTTKNDGTGTNYKEGDSYIVVKDNVTLYARWIYTVTFNGNGATVDIPNAAIADSGAVITLEAMTRTGYNFKGWNTSSDGNGTHYSAGPSYMVTENATLYAKWIPIYTVTYNGNGTTNGVPQAVSVDSETVITIPGQGNMARTGYSFGWWNTSSDGNGTNYSAGVSYRVTGNATLYAKWIPIYTVTYNGNNNTSGSAPKAITANFGSSVTLPGQSAMEKIGYSFGGWNTKSDGTGTNYAANSSYTVSGNVTLYAVWATPCTLTTIVSPSGGGSVSRSPDQTNYALGASVTVTATAASGYIFSNWSDASMSESASITVTMNGDRTLTANFHIGFTFTDTRDSKTYNAVKIGNQTWMVENLNYTPSSGNSWCYRNADSNCVKYGRLYDWATAMNIDTSYNSNMWGGSNVKHQGVCPSGWHLPSSDEWHELTKYANAGGKLKSTTGWYWSQYLGGGSGTNEFGFSALPGGCYYDYDGDFKEIGSEGLWWSASWANSDSSAGAMRIDYRDMFVGLYSENKSNGYSVRCLGD
jgi:uncharacterized protein (TIGR02145 family)/uncharacterized repeat protein (TIGR02543 family)